jgi:hypothetical protein
MEQPTLEQQREYVRIWKENTKILEQIKKEELRAMTEEEGAARALRLHEESPEPGEYVTTPTDSSGLVEQQRWFTLLREKLNRE